MLIADSQVDIFLYCCTKFCYIFSIQSLQAEYPLFQTASKFHSHFIGYFIKVTLQAIPALIFYSIPTQAQTWRFCEIQK